MELELLAQAVSEISLCLSVCGEFIFYYCFDFLKQS